MQTERFAKDVDEESKGEMKIQPFLASQLGSEQDTVQQVARGRIDMGGFSAGSAGAGGARDGAAVDALSTSATCRSRTACSTTT